MKRDGLRCKPCVVGLKEQPTWTRYASGPHFHFSFLLELRTQVKSGRIGRIILKFD